MTAFATVWPAEKLTLETTSRVPHEYTVMYPPAFGPLDTTFSETAPTPVAGTYPMRSVICTANSVTPPTWIFATLRRAFGDCPDRVSKTRFGPTDVKSDAAIDDTGGDVVVVV